MTRASLLLLVFAACSRSVETPPVPESRPASAPASMPHAVKSATLAVDLAVTATISVPRLRAHVVYLASDELEGRGSATEGIKKAADYLEKELRSYGLTGPFAGGSFRQSFELTTGTKIGEGNALQQGKRAFVLDRDFKPYPFSSSGEVEAPVVFAGYGITSKEHHYDDYAGMSVEGKIVVILPDEPGDLDPKSPFDGKRPTHHASLRNKVVRAREAKARAVLFVREKEQRQSSHHESETDAGIIAARVTPATAKALLGFDVVAIGKQIDRTYKPASRAGGGLPVKITAAIVRERRSVDNVGAYLIPQAATSTETVVIGAHYDHLGFGGWASLSGADKRDVHNGADDNASGTAVVLEIARELAREPSGLRRRVMFLLFAGEESGLLGSSAFVKNAPIDVKSIVAMINLDMVGRLRDRKLNVMGTSTGVELRQLARRFVDAHDLIGSYGGDGYGPSDHTSFYTQGIPVMFLFTGAHEDYHKPSDDAERINYPGMGSVALVATDLVRALATARDRPAYVAAPAPGPRPSRGGGYGPYFGSIPDFTEHKGGVLLSGVRTGSPAEKAGVKKGDVIVRFGEFQVQSLEDLTVALRNSAPGDVVEVTVQREGKPLVLKAKLEKRE